jgi:hypothetical protein
MHREFRKLDIAGSALERNRGQRRGPGEFPVRRLLGQLEALARFATLLGEQRLSRGKLCGPELRQFAVSGSVVVIATTFRFKFCQRQMPPLY